MKTLMVQWRLAYEEDVIDFIECAEGTEPWKAARAHAISSYMDSQPIEEEFDETDHNYDPKFYIINVAVMPPGFDSTKVKWVWAV